MEVKVVESSMVTPSKETPQKPLWLSPLDLMATRGHTPTVYFYRAGVVDDDFFNVSRMKAALSKALVFFYPVAGRIDVDGDGRLQVNCGGQGVHFNVANSDLTVDNFDIYKPSSELKTLFIPRIETPGLICAAQLTFLRCGGVALGMALHHSIVDAIGAFQFVQAWAAICRDDGDMATVEPPCHDHSLLRARSPPVVHPDALSVFCPMMDVRESGAPSGEALGCEAFVISKDQVTALKRACGGGVSTFCALTAHVWQCVCATRAMPPDATTRLTFPANVRRSLRPPLPMSYFGNGIIRLGVTGVVRDIGYSEELSAVAGKIKGAIRKMDDELVRSAIDYFELQAENDGGRRPMQGSLPTTELRVVSWLGMPVYDTDFGWGKPIVMLRAASERGGRVYLMDGVGDKDGSVRVLVCLEDAILKDFQRMLYAKFDHPAAAAAAN